jgi:hypothetical protein
MTTVESPYGPTSVALPVTRSSVKRLSFSVPETHIVPVARSYARPPVVLAFELIVPIWVLAPVSMSISKYARLLSTAMRRSAPRADEDNPSATAPPMTNRFRMISPILPNKTSSARKV